MNLLLAAVSALAVAAGAVPVDLRTLDSYPSSQAPAPRTDSIPVNDGPYFPGCEIMATRQVINELLAIVEVLQNEAWNLEHDALELWTQWRVFVPAPSGGGAAFALGPSGTPLPGPGAEDMRQSEIFGLYGQARALNGRGSGLMTRLRKLDAEWWTHWKILDAAAKSGRDGRELKPRMAAFKAKLEAAVSESNAVDAGVRQAQAQYDFTRPLALEQLSRRGANPALRQPWHWNYVLSGRPRPDMRYDFAARYELHYEESHEWLRTQRKAR